VIVAWILAGFEVVDFAIVIVAFAASIAVAFGGCVQSYFVASCWKDRRTWIVARQVVESYSVAWEDLLIGIVGRAFVAVAQSRNRRNSSPNGSLLGRDDWNLAVPRVVLLLLVIRDLYCAFVSSVFHVRCDSVLHVRCDSDSFHY
jgi:hypothetical protein